MIEVRNIGEYLDANPNGYLEKKANVSLIPSRWRPLIEDVIHFYRNEAQDGLIAVYVRGSVAKGTAVDFISDLDSFFITDRPFKLADAAKADFRRRASEKYPFCNGLELLGASRDSLESLHFPKRRNIWQELIKTQSACVWGKDLSDEISPFELKDMVAHSYWIAQEIEELPAKLENLTPGYSVAQVCEWIMKRIVRTGFEIVMLRENRWTRDLYPCFDSFSKYYPERKSLFNRAVVSILNPIEKPGDLLALVDEFKPWMFSEIKKHVPYAVA